jgi:hypothetical protein
MQVMNIEFSTEIKNNALLDKADLTSDSKISLYAAMVSLLQLPQSHSMSTPTSVKCP